MLLNKKFNLYEFTIQWPSDKFIKEELVKTITDIHNFLLEYNNYKTTHFNFALRDTKHDNDLLKLYDIFVAKSKEIFKEIEFSSTNDTTVWVNMTTRNDWNVKHNHIKTGNINSVYYLNVPDKSSGEIIFYDRGSELKYQPQEGKLIVFPSYLYHLPTCCNSDLPRIALNLEIQTLNNVWVTD